ncbi:MAG: Crp/Fnr family transcriptional regulator [Planctomycetes bacterium]|nr:Crp/Fnr family transcriptional regulator [Planctomycetota bacterium]
MNSFALSSPPTQIARLSACRVCAFLPPAEFAPHAVGLPSPAHEHENLVCRRDEPIYRAGSPCGAIHVLTEGLVAIRRIAQDGNAMIVRLVFPVTAFDLTAFLRTDRYSAEAVPLVPSRVCRLRREVFDRLAEHNPTMAMALMRGMAADLAAAEENLQAVAQRSARERLLGLLLRLATVGAPRTASDGLERFVLPLSRQDMASITAMRPETLARLLRDFEFEGLLRFRRRVVEVLDPGRLFAAVGESP